MNCTCAHVRLTDSTFPDGLFVVVTRGREGIIGNHDDVATAARPSTASSSSSSLFVRATDCDRCWSAPNVRPPSSTTLETWLDEVACALAGGRGEDEEKKAAAAAKASTSSSSSSTSTSSFSSTFPNARGHAHSVAAELKPQSGHLDLLVSWLNRETGDQARARVSLLREGPSAEAELEARRGVVSLALASAREAGAAAAELAAQNAELATIAEKAQASATGAESKWRAREGELFAKFAAVLNEKKAEAAKWKQLAEAGGVAGGVTGAAGAAVNTAAVADGGGRQGGGRAPDASGADGAAAAAAAAAAGGDPMLVEGATAAAAAAAVPAATAAGCDGDLGEAVNELEDDEELEGEEGGRSDSDGSRAAGEDEGYDDDEF